MLYLHSVKSDTTEREGWITLKEATEHCDYSQEYLSLLARQGKLPAVKLQRKWMTTRDAVDEYMRMH